MGMVKMVSILLLQTVVADTTTMITLLQVENTGVVNILGEQYLLNLELELGPGYTKIVGKNLSDVSCTPWFGEFYVLPLVVRQVISIF